MGDRDSPAPVGVVRSDADAVAERTLLARFAGGDPVAATTLYRLHAPVIARVVARLGVADRADVDDLVQITFLEAIRAAARFQGGSSVRTWLVAIAVNHARMLQRSRGRARRGLSLLAAEPAAPPRLHQDAVDQQERSRLHSALERISALQREALVLCELEGIPGAEVAAMLGVPVSTVWRRVHDAKVSLRGLLGDERSGS